MYLFSPCQIGHRTAPNRLLSQPMEANNGEAGGKVSELPRERYNALAKGGWGIVVVESIAVTPDSVACPNGLVLNKKNLESFQRLVEEFKTINSDALLLFQISHSGLKSYAPSPLKTIWPVPPEGGVSFSSEEIEAIRQAFVEGVLLAEKAGADGVDFKLCHGYFGAEILRPRNMRADKWGGGFENRTRFLRESVTDIRSALQRQDFLLGSRISMYEGIRGGWGTAGPDEIVEDLTETLRLLSVMEELGMDYVNVSAGDPTSVPRLTGPAKTSIFAVLQHFRYTKLAKETCHSLRVAGSAYTALGQEGPQYAEELLQKHYTDFVGFGRQALADPLYPQKLKNGDPINYCRMCSKCAQLLHNHQASHCFLFNNSSKQSPLNP